MFLKVEGEPPSPSLTLGLPTLFYGSIKNSVDYIERDHATANDGASSHRPP